MRASVLRGPTHVLLAFPSRALDSCKATIVVSQLPFTCCRQYPPRCHTAYGVLHKVKGYPRWPFCFFIFSLHSSTRCLKTAQTVNIPICNNSMTIFSLPFFAAGPTWSLTHILSVIMGVCQDTQSQKVQEERHYSWWRVQMWACLLLLTMHEDQGIWGHCGEYKNTHRVVYIF